MDEDKKLEDIYFYWMDRAIKAQRKATNKLFKQLNIDITSDQWIILKRLHEASGRSQRDLADAVSKDPASVTRSLDILEKQGLIERRVADRRSFTVHLTQKGTTLVELIIPEAVKYREMGVRGISDDEMKTFRRVLDTIYKNFN